MYQSLEMYHNKNNENNNNKLCPVINRGLYSGLRVHARGRDDLRLETPSHLLPKKIYVEKIKKSKNETEHTLFV